MSNKGLILQLDVREDDKLRKFVNELVEGGVKKILRGDIKKFISDVIAERVKAVVNNELIKNDIKYRVERAVENIIYKNKDTITEEARALIQEELKIAVRNKINKFVDEIN